MNRELSVRADGTASAIQESIMAKLHELNYKPMPRAEIALLAMPEVLLWHLAVAWGALHLRKVSRQYSPARHFGECTTSTPVRAQG